MSAVTHKLKKQNLVEISISSTVLPFPLKFRSLGEPHFEIRRVLVKEFQLKESSRYKKIAEKSIEAKTSGIGHGSWEVGKNTSSIRVKIECVLRVI
jgi:hypothetical protein